MPELTAKVPAMCRYEALLIDFDGVLRHWQPSDIDIERAFSLPAGAIRAAAFEPAIMLPAITGKTTDAEWRPQTADRIERQHRIGNAAEAVRQWSSFPGAVDQRVLSLVADCRRALKVVLVTNATSRLVHDLRALSLLEQFDAIVNSAEVGVAKPNAEIFDIALRRVGAPPEGAIFIDDTPAHVLAAESFGITSRTFVGHEQMASFLRECGALP